MSEAMELLRQEIAGNGQLALYARHTGEITCELLDDMVGFILDKKEWEED